MKQNLICKYWAHNWDFEVPSVYVCARCGFIEDYSVEDYSLDNRRKVESLVWNLERFYITYFQFQKCGYCKKRQLRIFGKQISKCASDCLPF